MRRLLRERSSLPELMDDLTQGGEELREALRHLRRLNRLFAAAAPTLYGVNRLWVRAGKPRRLSMLDIGAGSGDVNAALLRWADAQGIELTVTLVDRTQEACAEAAALFANEPRISVICRDLSELDEQGADIVTGSQFLHHFESAELPDAASAMLRASRMGIVIQDIHRHWLAWAAVWLAARLVSGNRYIRNDGPLSVAKGFRKEDWMRLNEALGIPGMTCNWRPLFRYVVTIPVKTGVSAHE
ncbi:methyltransferase domain-containing protein [Paenibacillus rhizovicinus]|uniref:Methyltransferase domain-containing protein n=1 Tax=Paenibacillus rhizovicinus TaxID=2704463 RepID=A0A6C0NUC9_9BACL|nr:methyltransferase domain-containing protein [Paenibacillus rhizovicinus]QHW29777.1 methyltransferase domain-containing protein [Paenibacillus rhizovicinus]